MTRLKTFKEFSKFKTSLSKSKIRQLETDKLKENTSKKSCLLKCKKKKERKEIQDFFKSDIKKRGKLKNKI